jgi:hypothetical protein
MPPTFAPTKKEIIKELKEYFDLLTNTTKAPLGGKKVNQLTLDGKLVKVWRNANEAERFGGFCHSNIRKCCIGIWKTSCGYKWEFAEDRCQKN